MLNNITSIVSGGSVTKTRIAVIGLILLGLVTLPVWGSSYVYVMGYASIWAIFAMGWDIISGHTGYISFGHSLLSGGAAYTTALIFFNIDPNMSMLVTFPVSIIAAVLIGWAFALPSLRLRGPYFSLVTFVGALIGVKLVTIFSGYTNGELGIQAVPVFTYNTTLLYYITLSLMIIIAIVLTTISRSYVGRILIGIRENESGVEEAGINTTKFKLWAFTVSAIVMGIGGATLAHFYGNVAPANSLAVHNSILMIGMAAVGGMGTILAPAGGAYLLIVLRDIVFRSIIPLGPNERFLALWVFIIVLLVAVPEGIFKQLWNKIPDLSGDHDE